MERPNIQDLINRVKFGIGLRGLYIGLEGPDAVGKSAVARRIGEITGIQKFHRRSLAFGNPDGYNPNASLGMEWAALKLCSKFGLCLLEERTFLGFAIYANHPEFTDSIARELISMVEDINAVYIFLEATPQTIHERLEKSGEFLPNIDKEILRYKDFAEKPLEPYKHLDIRIVDANRTVEDVSWDIIKIMRDKLRA